MKHTIPHDLDRPLAIKATKKALESYQERFAEYNPTADWTAENAADIAFSVKRVSLGGHVEVNADNISLELEVPFMLRPFKAKAISVIEKEIQGWIERAKNGELD